MATGLEHSRPFVSGCAGMDSGAGMDSAYPPLPVERRQVGYAAGSAAAAACAGNGPASGPIRSASGHGPRQPPPVGARNTINSDILVLGRDDLRDYSVVWDACVYPTLYIGDRGVWVYRSYVNGGFWYYRACANGDVWYYRDGGKRYLWGHCLFSRRKHFTW